MQLIIELICIIFKIFTATVNWHLYPIQIKYYKQYNYLGQI